MWNQYLALLLIVSVLISCNPGRDQLQSTDPQPLRNEWRVYSKKVKDSFTVFMSLPKEYQSNTNQKYPVVFLLDANLYFDMMATIIENYAEVGLAPQVILVGIGYRDFMLMDSLRNRDDTYPVAIPEYEMPISGGAGQFLSFIDKELIPLIDNRYRTDTASRTLMGHSLGGYFTCYALQRNLSGQKSGISKYIAASPSLHYNNYYLLDELKQASTKGRKEIQTYITYGGLEENSTDTSALTQERVLRKLQEILSSKITYKADVYSNLSHMDTQLPTFIKGLQQLLMQEK